MNTYWWIRGSEATPPCLPLGETNFNDVIGCDRNHLPLRHSFSLLVHPKSLQLDAVSQSNNLSGFFFFYVLQICFPRSGTLTQLLERSRQHLFGGKLRHQMEQDRRVFRQSANFHLCRTRRFKTHARTCANNDFQSGDENLRRQFSDDIDAPLWCILLIAQVIPAVVLTH